MAHGISAQSARETQRFLGMLEVIDATTVETDEVRRYREGLPGDPWASFLAQALEELLLEEQDATVLPIAYVRNWLGECSREVRRMQQGLLLTSAHRAKGLEFDHVVILDGLWRKTSHLDDRDSPLRLYYVSMTRARETLALVQLEDGNRTNTRDTPLADRQDERAARLLQPLKRERQKNWPARLSTHCSQIRNGRDEQVSAVASRCRGRRHRYYGAPDAI